MVVSADPLKDVVTGTTLQTIEKLVRIEWGFDWSLVRVPLVSISPKYSHATGYFSETKENWIEYPPYVTPYGKGNFTFIPNGVSGGYLYLVDPTRHLEADPNRPFTLRIPVEGGMIQWSFPNPWRWQDLYVVQPDE